MRNPWMAMWLEAVNTSISATRAFWASVLQPQSGQQQASDAGNGNAPRSGRNAEKRAKFAEPKADLESRGAAGRPSAAKPAGSEKRAAAEPKFRHPTDPNLTWSGRGRRPRWLTEALEAGRDLDDLKIAKR